ncbi:MAG: hypothetical protein GW936_08745 [Gallionella sp.]|nr:hypothetical protein [Gallionella sp.]
MKNNEQEELVFRLKKRAEIRRQIPTRKSVQEGKPDRIADLLEEAATEIERLRSVSHMSIQKLDALQPEPDVGGIAPGHIDKATTHEDADRFLLDALRASGQGKVADAWEAARARFDGWWYS